MGAMRSAGRGDEANVMDVVGPPMWETLHHAAFQCPEPFAERAAALVSMARAYATVLPCAECRRHFCVLLDDHPPEAAAAGGRDAFARWTVDVHNSVNARLGKPIVSFQQAQRRYGCADLRCREGDGATGGTSAHGGRRLAVGGKRPPSTPAVGAAAALLLLVLAGVALAAALHQRRVPCAREEGDG